jgi:hypothetical protein
MSRADLPRIAEATPEGRYEPYVLSTSSMALVASSSVTGMVVLPPGCSNTGDGKLKTYAILMRICQTDDETDLEKFA